MADSSGPVRAAVYFDSEEAHKQVEATLGPLPAGADGRFSGVAEGDFDPEAIKQLSKAGLVVEVLASDPAASAPPSPAGPSQTLAAKADLIEEIKEQAGTVSFSADESGLVLGGGEAAPDPRLHQLDDYEAEPAPQQALTEDAYNIEIEGRITRAQRLQLDKLKVDIAAYEPGRGYRTVLTRAQYAKVLKLPYVTAVSRYDLSQTVTPELLEVADEEVGGEPGTELMSGGEEAAPEVRTFDCIVHREADIDEIRSLIENTEGTEIVGTTSLRVRFTAATRLPLLAALAALPAVRKISPYEAPTIISPDEEPAG